MKNGLKKIHFQKALELFLIEQIFNINCFIHIQDYFFLIFTFFLISFYIRITTDPSDKP